MSTPAGGGVAGDRSGDPGKPSDGGLSADDVDLELVAEDRADALEPVRAAALDRLVRSDPSAADRYAGFARLLDGLAAAVAAEPAPAVPDDVVPRLDAALEREVQARYSQDAAVAANSRRAATAPRRRALGRWAGGLGAVAGLAGVVALVVHTGGAGGSSATSAASGLAGVSAAAPARTPADPDAAGSGAGGSAPTPTSAASASPVASAAPAGIPPVVTGATLASLARSVYDTVTPLPAAAPGGLTAASSRAAPSGTESAPLSGGTTTSLCRPAGVSAQVLVLAQTRVTFAGAPAVLVVLAGSPAHPGTVRASVLRHCGGSALLSREVAVAR